jgi:hypothetical protein
MQTKLEELEELFGEVEDYYPEESEANDKRAAWNRSRDHFCDTVREAIETNDAKMFQLARNIESEWGDSPLWNKLADEYPDLTS